DDRRRRRRSQARTAIATLQGESAEIASQRPQTWRARHGRADSPNVGRRAGRRMMQMTGFVVRDAIIPKLRATTKEAVIREMVESLRDIVRIQPEDSEEIIKAILKRELLGSTGIGQGVAIPHAKHRSVEKLMGTVA